MQEPEERTPSRKDAFSTATPGPVIPPLRVAVGLGDPERERRLLPALSAGGSILVAERCLSADHLITCIEAGAVDVAVIADDLHRLTDDALAILAQSRIPLVVLAARPHDERWQAIASIALPLDAAPEAVQQATFAVRYRDRSQPVAPPDDRLSPSMATTAAPEASPSELATFAVASGHGSPGRTIVALNIAAALGAVAPTVLVDADIAGPSVAAYLDLDPTRNLFMLAHADPRSPRDWDQAIAAETQPLSPRSPQGVALCGIPKPEMRAGVSAHFFKQLLSELRQRYRFVILDIGADLLSTEVGLHRLALGASQQVLFVATADLVGLWHARVGLGLLGRSLSITDERVALLINRYDRRFHHSRTEIEWNLGRPLAALISDDRTHVQRAVLAQYPLVLNRRSRAGRTLLDLAERVQGGRIILPPEHPAKRRYQWLRRIGAFGLRWHWRREPKVKMGGSDEHNLAATR